MRARGNGELQRLENEIHVWTTRLDTTDNAAARARETLAASEHERAARFRFPRDQRRFVLSRGFLRQTLARYLDVAAQALVFEYGKHGKPRLDPDSTPAQIEFNLSHAADVAVLVLGRKRLVGADIESLDRDADHANIAQRYFAPSEATSLDLLPAERRLPAFLRLWTIKEAYLKALGLGLSGGMSGLVVPPTKWEYDDAFGLADKSGKVWTIKALTAPEGYVASGAVEGPEAQIVQRNEK